MEGNKYDDGKDDWSLLPWLQVKEAVKVLIYGAVKYERDNWQHVKDAKHRYSAAFMRHMNSW